MTFNGTYMGDTYGGVSLNISEVKKTTADFGGGRILSAISGLVGVLKAFECSEMSLVDEMDFSVEGVIVMTGKTFRITINNAYFTKPSKFDLGTNRQKSFDWRFEAIVRENITSSNPLFKLEEI